MKHNIEVEKFIRDRDGKSFVRVIMTGLAGSDHFKIVCMSETASEALVQLGHRLRLVSEDAKDISEKLLEKFQPKEEKGSFRETGHSGLRLVHVNWDEEDKV